MNHRPLIAHVVFRFDYGGLENGIVSIVNSLAGGQFRHVIIALTEATAFSQRLDQNVTVYSIGKKPGKDLLAYLRLYRLLRSLKPAVVHTRNFGTLDCSFVAFFAGVPLRIHGEHGWDVFDPDGSRRKYRLMRRFFFRFVDIIVAVSEELRQWLIESVGISPGKVRRICNGVNVDKFRPAEPADTNPLPISLVGRGNIVIGSVTRFSEIKDPLNLVDAFISLRRETREALALRLVMIGDGELHEAAVDRLRQAGALNAAWLPGSRDDVAALMRAMHVFVLGSRREGVSNTVLEAMASGLPVVASATGGNSELVIDDRTGRLVPPGDSFALAGAVSEYIGDERMRIRHGRFARQRVVEMYGIGTMVDSYRRLYEVSLDSTGD